MRKLNSSRLTSPNAWLLSLSSYSCSCVGEKLLGEGVQGKRIWPGMGVGSVVEHLPRMHKAYAGFQTLFSVAELITRFPGEKDKQSTGNVEITIDFSH